MFQKLLALTLSFCAVGGLTAQTATTTTATVDINFFNVNGTPNRTTYTTGTAIGTAISTDANAPTSLGTVNTNGPLSFEDIFVVADPQNGCVITGGSVTAVGTPQTFLRPGTSQTLTIPLEVVGTCGVDFPVNPPNNLAPCTGSQVALGIVPGTTTEFDLTAVGVAAAFITRVDASVTFTLTTSAGCTSPPVVAEANFQVQAGVVPLPVTLTSFTATRQVNRDLVEWTVEDERDLAGYAVEQSTDGTHFAEVRWVDALGTDNARRSYGERVSALSEALAATTYYRLRSVDLDGSFALSSVVAVGGGDQQWAPQDLVAYPNPSLQGGGFAVNAPIDTDAHVEVYDLQGRQVMTQSGVSQSTIGQDLAAGTYLVRVTSASGTSECRVVVQ